MPKCKSCGADIKFMRLQNGNTITVDKNSLVPVRPGGNKTVCIVTYAGEVIFGDPVWKGHPEAVLGYVSHFATCPDAEKYRRENSERKRKAVH